MFFPNSVNFDCKNLQPDSTAIFYCSFFTKLPIVHGIIIFSILTASSKIAILLVKAEYAGVIMCNNGKTEKIKPLNKAELPGAQAIGNAFYCLQSMLNIFCKKLVDLFYKINHLIIFIFLIFL
jgi:hypothetical protein